MNLLYLLFLPLRQNSRANKRPATSEPITMVPAIMFVLLDCDSGVSLESSVETNTHFPVYYFRENPNLI